MNRIPGPDSALDWRINMFHFSEVRSHFSKHYLNSMVRSLPWGKATSLHLYLRLDPI